MSDVVELLTDRQVGNALVALRPLTRRYGARLPPVAMDGWLDALGLEDLLQHDADGLVDGDHAAGRMPRQRVARALRGPEAARRLQPRGPGQVAGQDQGLAGHDVDAHPTLGHAAGSPRAPAKRSAEGPAKPRFATPGIDDDPRWNHRDVKSRFKEGSAR